MAAPIARDRSARLAVGSASPPKRTRPYRPQTNGKAERVIQTLLRKWAYAVPYATSAQRRAALVPWLRFYNERNTPCKPQSPNTARPTGSVR